jgi:hypothetical protein
MSDPQQQGNNLPSSNNNSNNQEDYADKGIIQVLHITWNYDANGGPYSLLLTGLDALEKKFGQGKVDPTKMRSTNEKITDGLRQGFEKLTGYVASRNPLLFRRQV